MGWITSIFNRKKKVPETEALDASITTPSKETAAKADNPIHDASGDALGRVASAEIFCRSVLRFDASEGLVVGVLGPWGAGKTSFLNLTRQVFEQESIAVVDFNPWMFSGAEQLVQSFFSELSAQLKLKPGLEDVGKTLEEYGEIFSNLTWLPVVGPWIERGQDIAKLVANVLQRKKEGITGQRLRVNNALKKVNYPIIVIIDDIDRLSTSEIRDIFRLVRLTANFPNLIYLLAFDRKRVEAALSEEGFPGRAYLEKILQLCFDLPVIPESVLNQQIFSALDAVLDDIENRGNFCQDLWPDVFMEVIKPLITNMRDVRRYAAAVGGTVRDLQGQIELVDVLGLEAIRIFLPDVFQRLPLIAGVLTNLTGYSHRNREKEAESKRDIEELLKLAGPHSGSVHAMVERMFMAGQRHIGGTYYSGESSRTWLRKRRVAHLDILRLYLERVAGQGLLAFNKAQEAWMLLPDQSSFEAFLLSLPRTQVVDVISNLEAYEDEILPDHVVPGIVTLLNFLPELPESDRGFFSFGNDLVVSRVVYRLVRSQNSEEYVEASVRQALPQLRTLYAKLMLIEMIGHKDGVGHKLVSQETAAQLLRGWRDELRNLSVAELAGEPELLRTTLMARRESDSEEPQFVVPADPRITLALLASSRSESRTQAMGSRSVKRFPRLAWEALIEVYGSEDILRERIQEVKAQQLSCEGDVLELADRYLSGWRPKDFGDE